MGAGGGGGWGAGNRGIEGFTLRSRTIECLIRVTTYTLYHPSDEMPLSALSLVANRCNTITCAWKCVLPVCANV